MPRTTKSGVVLPLAYPSSAGASGEVLAAPCGVSVLLGVGLRTGMALKRSMAFL